MNIGGVRSCSCWLKNCMRYDVKKACPCGSGALLKQCCGPYIEGVALPPTPEALMRSRYTAYVLANIDYIRDTSYGEALTAFSYEDSLDWAENASWKGLEVTDSSLVDANRATVEFSVLFVQSGLEKRLEEKSRFLRVEERWYYEGSDKFRLIDQANKLAKLGRNDPCHCGSGKKHKKCCA